MHLCTCESARLNFWMNLIRGYRTVVSNVNSCAHSNVGTKAPFLQIKSSHVPALVAGGALLAIVLLTPATLHSQMVVPAGTIAKATHDLLFFKVCCFIEAACFLMIALSGWTWKKLDPAQLIATQKIDPVEIMSRRTASCALVVITILGTILRLVSLDNSLWLDEITPLSFYRETSLLGLLTTYFSTNNHLLYTILERAFVYCFGEAEWVVRLPAVVFGIATIPVLYLLSRIIAPRIVSLGVALLLSVSYHHIFFSQNARGYAPHLFFSLAATVCLVRALSKDKVKSWILYCTCMVLNMASIMASLSVLIAHIVIDGCIGWTVSGRGISAGPILRRFTAVLAITLLLVLHLYSVILPQAYEVMQATYHAQSTGFTLLSADFVQEVARGSKIGAMIWLAAIPAAAIGVLGAVTTFRSSWVLFLGLLLPEVLLAGYLLVMNLAVSPRFFLLALPFGLLILSVGLHRACRLIGSRLSKVSTVPAAYAVVVFLICLVNIPLLVQYYRIPKQDFRSAAVYLKSKTSPRAFDVAIYTAKEGFAYYAKRNGLQENLDFTDIRTLSDLQSVMYKHDPQHIFLVTTFPRALHLDHPELELEIDKHWVLDRVFPGSIGDGDVTVWKPRPVSAMTHQVAVDALMRQESTLTAILPDGVKVLRDIPYVDGSDSRSQMLDLFIPNRSGQPLPIIVLVHGGAWDHGDKNTLDVVPFLEHGYAVACINYRLSTEACFPAQLDDCRSAVVWLHMHGSSYGLDSQNIGAYGVSAGAYLAALLGTACGAQETHDGLDKKSGCVQAVCIGSGPTDLTSYTTNAGNYQATNEAVAKLLCGAVESHMAKAKQASPITYATQKTAPFLIIHGDQDTTISPEQSKKFYAALKRGGNDATLLIVHAGHGGPEFKEPAVMNKVFDFFDKHLRRQAI